MFQSHRGLLFAAYAGEEAVVKERAVEYKQNLQGKAYGVQSANSMLVSVNSLLNCLGWFDCKMKNIRAQRQTYL